MTERRRPRARTQAAGYLAADIGRKPVSERTQFVSVALRPARRRKPVSEETQFPSAHCARCSKAQICAADSKEDPYMNDYNNQNPNENSGQEQQPGAPQQPGQQPPYHNPYPYQNQSYYQQPYGQPPYGQPPKQTNNLALASMIVGIFALLACCIPFVQFPLAVVSIVLVVLSKKGQPLSGFAIAGLVLAIISIIISILMTLYWGFLISMMNDPEFMSIYNEMLEMYE